MRLNSGNTYLLGLVLSFFLSCSSMAQTSRANFDSLDRYENAILFDAIDSSTIQTFPFIHFERNQYQFYTAESASFEGLYYRIQQMVKHKDQKLNFYHIGGSHIQADVYSNLMREQLQTRWKNLPGERGWVFPFNLAGTNNPANYRFASPNKWTGYRSVVSKHRHVDYGLMGMAMSCTDDFISMTFNYKVAMSRPPIDLIRIYHQKGAFNYRVSLVGDSTLVRSQFTDEVLGCTDIQLSREVDSFTVNFAYVSEELQAVDSLDSLFVPNLHHEPLVIYGFELLNDRPGISYTSIGVNGAGLYTYLDNVYFEEQLKQYPPDFFAFSVGTNDANTTYAKFDPKVYQSNLRKMMEKVLRANPNCAILLTVPNDALYNRRYLNKNVARERAVIIELAKEYQIPVWDFYGIMGGLGSSRTWHRNKLMRADHVHFTHQGYLLKGQMFYISFLKWLEQMDVFQYDYLKRS